MILKNLRFSRVIQQIFQILERFRRRERVVSIQIAMSYQVELLINTWVKRSALMTKLKRSYLFKR